MRILLVEDDAALARGLTATLRKDGFAVDHVADGAAALDVAKRVEKLLEARGYRVKLTRTGDTRFSSNPRVDLPLRADFANKALADLFVSIHFNHAPESIRGVETYTFTPRGMLSTASTEPDDDTSRAFPGNRYDHANLLLGFARE